MNGSAKVQKDCGTMSELLGLGLHAASGGLFGMLGTIGGRVLGIFEARDKRKHDLALRAFRADENAHDLIVLDRNLTHEKELHQLNMEQGARETENELALIRTNQSYAGLAVSMAHDTAAGVASQWVINVLRLVRPVLTFTLWVVVFSLVKIGANPNYVKQAIFAATASTLWWFGDRAPTQNGLIGQGV